MPRSVWSTTWSHPTWTWSAAPSGLDTDWASVTTVSAVNDVAPDGAMEGKVRHYQGDAGIRHGLPTGPGCTPNRRTSPWSADRQGRRGRPGRSRWHPPVQWERTSGGDLEHGGTGVDLAQTGQSWRVVGVTGMVMLSRKSSGPSGGLRSGQDGDRYGLAVATG